jgi:hypothetical protein
MSETPRSPITGGDGSRDLLADDVTSSGNP